MASSWIFSAQYGHFFTALLRRFPQRTRLPEAARHNVVGRGPRRPERDSMAASMGERVAVLVSGGGTNLQALLDDPRSRPRSRSCISDRPGVRGLERATDAGVPSLVIEPDGFADRGRSTPPVADALAADGIDVVVTAGYMRVLGGAGRSTRTGTDG